MATPFTVLQIESLYLGANASFSHYKCLPVIVECWQRYSSQITSICERHHQGMKLASTKVPIGKKLYTTNCQPQQHNTTFFLVRTNYAYQLASSTMQTSNKRPGLHLNTCLIHSKLTIGLHSLTKSHMSMCSKQVPCISFHTVVAEAYWQSLPKVHWSRSQSRKSEFYAYCALLVDQPKPIHERVACLFSNHLPFPKIK